MVQVHVPAKEWGFDSPLGHHISFGCERVNHIEKLNRGNQTPLSIGYAARGSLGPRNSPMTPPPKTPSFGALLLANVKVLLGVTLFMILAFFLWRGIAAMFPEIAWLQGPMG